MACGIAAPTLYNTTHNTTHNTQGVNKMAYTTINFKTKKELIAALADGKKISIYQPSPFDNKSIDNGIAYLEGPHYPQPHRWYARVMLQDGYIIEILK